MPSAIMDPPPHTPSHATPQPLPMMGNRGFNIAHQKVALEIDLQRRRLRGHTEITINPTDASLRQIRLNCRQCDIKKCSINGRTVREMKYDDPYAGFKLHETAGVHQHHMLRKKMEGVLHDPPEFELVLTIPSKVRIEQADPFNAAAVSVMGRVAGVQGGKPRTPDVVGGQPTTPGAPLTARPENLYTPYVPLNLKIEFVIEEIRDGFTFVGCEEGDMRYPHAYTTNTPLPGASSCLFPTLDGIHERWTWEFEVTVPRTIGDIGRTQEGEAAAAAKEERATTNGINGTAVDEDGDTQMVVDEDPDADLDMVVVCSGDFVDEEFHPTQRWKKVVKFVQSQAVAPQHVSIAVGPFERVNLSEYRDVENEEAMGNMTVDVLGYCLPGREADLKNTCMFLPKAIDFIVKEFGQYVFQAFKLCFVDDLATDTVESASLALCSNRLLFPETVIDAIWPVTRQLTYALTAQWAGVQVVPKDWADIWVIVGIAYWMTGCFLKNLMGNNEYRFRLKKDAEKICELDVGRPSLYAQGFQVPIEPSQLDFIKLKAPVVLTILEKRLWKLSSSMVLHRVVRKTFLSAVAGELKNGLMSTAHFIRLCEKNSHNKLEAFFQQWVYGSGYPIFEVSQRFNKKRMIVEMGIRQAQSSQNIQRKVTPEEFMKDASDMQRHVVVGAPSPVFTGPMTIRIHEADGTPYEHVVDLKEGYTKLDIPYNTKYKRLKRSRRQKERAAAGAGVDVSIDAQQNDDVLLYCLGDVLQSEEEVDYWRLVDWSKEDEEKMAQESFEWIRMDADFEWICQLNINQPDYMFLSQLQQDRDVIAQYDSIRHFATVRESALISSILVRTLMDRRYYYGIRVEAALALARCATADLEWVGQFHLMKAFQEFFCFPDSTIPRGNDFSDFTAYYVQNAIPQAMSRIRNLSGVCPSYVQKWLVDLLRYNDNSNNTYDDCFYIANLMMGLANTLTPNKMTPQDMEYGFEFDDSEGREAQEMAIKEISRYQRMDQWQPSYRNIISETALEIRRLLAIRGVQDIDWKMLMSYCREGTLDTLRVKALDCLVDLNGLRLPALMKYLTHVMAYDPSPYVRRRVQIAFGRGLGMLATQEPEQKKNGVTDPGALMIEDDNAVDSAQAQRKDEIAKGTIEGAVLNMKRLLKEDKVLQAALWEAVKSPEVGLIELRYFLDICKMLYEPKTSLVVVLKQPKHLSCTHLGKGKLRFRWAYGKPLPSSARPPPPPTVPYRSSHSHTFTKTSTPAPPTSSTTSSLSSGTPHRTPSIKLITNPRGRVPGTSTPVNGERKKIKTSPKAVRRTPSFNSHTRDTPTPGHGRTGSMGPPVYATSARAGTPGSGTAGGGGAGTPGSQGSGGSAANGAPRKIILKIGKKHLEQAGLGGPRRDAK